jgi:replicative DNA helicase
MAEGTPLPNDLQAEAACVSAAILDPRRYDEVAGLLEPHRFYNKANAAIWEAIGEVRKLGVEVDLATIGRWLKKHGQTPQPVSLAYLAKVVDETPSMGHVGSHAKSVFDCWRLRSLHSVALGAVAHIEHDSIEDVDAYAAELSQQVEHSGRSPALAGSTWIGDGISAAFQSLQDRIASGQSSGVSTGFTRLDYASGGLARKRVYTLGARAGMGKTALAINIALNVARSGAVVQYFSLEMGRGELSKRALCCESKVSLDVLKRPGGSLSQQDWASLAATAASLNKRSILWDDSTALTVPRLRAKVTQFQAELSNSGRELFLVVIDHALKMRGTNQRAPRREQIIEITGGLKDLAKDLNVCVLELAQLNRQLESRQVKDKRPRIADLKESGSFEEDADQVWLLHRADKFESDSSKHNHEAEVILAKVRDDGEEGFVKLRFDGPTRRFDNLETDSPDNPDHWEKS